MDMLIAGSTVSSGPFDLISGIPVHALVVHAVVVLVPLAAIGAVVMAAWPRFSRRHGWLVAAVSVVAAACAFVAKLAGDALVVRFGEPGFDHAAYGTWMPWFALALSAVTIALCWVDRAAPVEGPNPRRTLRLVLACATVVVAIANGYWVFKTGDSGARSVWTGRVPQ